MDVHIEEVVAEVTAVDGDALLSPLVLGRIVRAVLAAVESVEDERRRRDDERTIGRSMRGDDW